LVVFKLEAAVLSRDIPDGTAAFPKSVASDKNNWIQSEEGQVYKGSDRAVKIVVLDQRDAAKWPQREVQNVPRSACFLLFSILIITPLTMLHTQDNASAASPTRELKTVVVALKAKSDSVIAVPPAVSMTFALKEEKHAADTEVANLTSWLSRQTTLNGLQSTDLRPWHIVVNYDQYDEDGDNVHSGVYEEYWAGAKKYKRIYESDDFNQTDYATEKGLYRKGDQRWPNSTQSKVRAEVIDPFFYAATLEGFHGRIVEHAFGRDKLECVLIAKTSEGSNPIQYCFEPASSILRYDHGFGWLQTVYNRIVSFQGRNLAQEVEVTDGGKAYLKLRVDKIELIPQVDETEFIPPPDAIGPIVDRVSDVEVTETKMVFPEWPASMRGQHFTVQVEFIIGKDGHVVSAHGVSGPPDAYKACEDAYLKSTYRPYFVLDEPVEVKEKGGCTYN
jgi:hypothetical protein